MPTVPLTGVETFYPTQPTPQSNVTAYQQDDGQWDEVQKSASAWRNETVTLKHRIKDANIEAFVEFLNTNTITPTVTLNLPGFYPFLRTNTSNTVRILGYSKPVKSPTFPLHWELSVKYRNVLKVPQ